MPKITELFAFVAEDNGPANEGIMAFKAGDTFMPLIGADMARIDSLRFVAEQIKAASGKPYRILKFKLDGEIA